MPVKIPIDIPYIPYLLSDEFFVRKGAHAADGTLPPEKALMRGQTLNPRGSLFRGRPRPAPTRPQGEANQVLKIVAQY